MDSEKKLLGVIGGLGPMATALFLERIVRFTDAETDQDHIDITIRHCPSIPDRTRYLLDHSAPNPLPGILRAGRSIARDGAYCIAVPCITAHMFLSELEAETGCKVIDAISLATDVLSRAGVSRAAVWATEGTIHAELFQRALHDAGITPVLPNSEMQRIITDCIYRDIKAGQRPDMEKLMQVRHDMLEEGAQSIILGCTELSVAFRLCDPVAGVLDVLNVLATASITECGARVRPEYSNLFKPLRGNL